MSQTDEKADPTPIDKVMAEVFAGPKVFNALPPVFRACIDPSVIRYDLDLPWHRGGFAYATDGRIAVRMAVPEHIAKVLDNAKPGRRMTPRMEDLFVGKFREEGIAPPKGPRGFVVCDVCGGFGIALSRDRADCEPCEECYGKGCVPRQGIIEVAPGFSISDHHAAILRRFKGEIYLPVDAGTYPNLTPIKFVMLGLYDGEAIEGRMMPCYQTGGGS